MSEYKYKYFVSYAYSNGYGYCFHNTNAKIKEADEIKTVAADIAEKITHESVVILNFILLSKEKVK